MKRTLVAAVATGLLLTGCATGDTGHLNPEISPDLVGPRSTPEPDQPSGDSGEEDTVETPAPGSSGAAGSEVEQAFAEAYGEESWYAEVTGVDPDDDTIVVTTLLQAGDPVAVEVCQAAVDVAEGTGIASPSVLVRDADGDTLSQLDAAAGDEGCSS